MCATDTAGERKKRQEDDNVGAQGMKRRAGRKVGILMIFVYVKGVRQKTSHPYEVGNGARRAFNGPGSHRIRSPVMCSAKEGGGGGMTRCVIELGSARGLQPVAA